MILYVSLLVVVIIASLYILLRSRPSGVTPASAQLPSGKDGIEDPKVRRQILNDVKNNFKIEARKDASPVQFLFVTTTGIAEARVGVVLSNLSPHPLTIEKITWELWLGQFVKSAIFSDPVTVPPNTQSFEVSLMELLSDEEAAVADHGRGRGNVDCYVEGSCYCRTEGGNFERKFALLNLKYEILGEAKSKEPGSAGEAQIDSFTGFMQRRFIEGNLQSIIDNTGGRHPISLIMIDLDHFKTINDKYGHLAGDEAIKIVCQQIKVAMIDRGIPVRYGGDEFAIILEYCESQDAEFMAQRILDGVRQCHFSAGDREWKMTLSIGVATLRQAADYKVLIKRADDMLLRSKQEGRNRITVDRVDRRAEGSDRRRT